MERIKSDLSRIREKLGDADAYGLCWQAKRILRLYARGYTDWTKPPYRQSWQTNYREALKRFGPEFANPEKLTQKTLYWMFFMISFTGGKDSEASDRAVFQFHVLARMIAPQQVQELLEDHPSYLKAVDEVILKLKKPVAEVQQAVNE